MQLGKFETNNIYLGDSYKLIKDIPDKSVDLIITDPPYDIGDGGCTGIFKNRGHKNGGLYMTQIMEGNFGKGFDFKILDEMIRIMKFINIYIWCNKEQLYDYLNYFKDKNCNFELIVWAKQTFPPFTCGHFCKDKELCLYFWEKGKMNLTGSWEQMRTVLTSKINMQDKKDFEHPCIKPLEFIKRFVEISSERGG